MAVILKYYMTRDTIGYSIKLAICAFLNHRNMYRFLNNYIMGAAMYNVLAYGNK